MSHDAFPDAENSSPINLASKYLTTFLANTKDDSGIDALPPSLHDNLNKPTGNVAPDSVQDDNDFSVAILISYYFTTSTCRY